MNETLQRLLQSASKAELDRIPPAELVAPAKITSDGDTRLVKAALYLKHGFLDDCHKIAQQVETPTGSYWHGIMHRQEGDLSNSKYWYARVGQHPVLEAIGGYPNDAATEQREFDLLLQHTIQSATQ